MDENKQENYTQKSTRPSIIRGLLLCLAIVALSLGIGTGAWLLLRAPVTYGTPGERLKEDSKKTLQGYQADADARKMAVELVSSYGHKVKTTPYGFSARTLPGYKFKVPVDESKGVRAVIDDISDGDVDSTAKKVEADLKVKGFTYKEYEIGDSYYISKDFICDIIALTAADLRTSGTGAANDDDPEVEAPFVQVACVSIADYVKSAEFYKPLYDAIIADTTYQYWEISMLPRSPIESTVKGYWRLEAASVSLADTTTSLEHGVSNRAWFYKTPASNTWYLLKGSVSNTPSCEVIEKNADAKKVFNGAECRDKAKATGPNTTRKVQ